MEEQHLIDKPSSWVVRHLPLVPQGGQVLDLACGNGRHAIWMAQQGYQVDAIDRDILAVSGLLKIVNINVGIIDLETEEGLQTNKCYDGVIVSRYLYRPLFRMLFEILKPGGVLIYETFMIGNEQYGKPSNPDFLLLRDELFAYYSPLLFINAFEQGEEKYPRPAVMQRICATKLFN